MAYFLLKLASLLPSVVKNKIGGHLGSKFFFCVVTVIIFSDWICHATSSPTDSKKSFQLNKYQKK